MEPILEAMKKYVSQEKALQRVCENAFRVSEREHHERVNQKAVNASKEGQVAMAQEAASRAPAFQMNRIVKSKGGVGFPNDMIESANSILLHSIKDNLIREYNDILTADAIKWDHGGKSTQPAL